MRLREHYDWVVLGDHPGALLSASLVARLGMSVLVLPVAPAQKAVISRSGQCLDPEPNFLLGLGKIERSDGLLADCLSRLGMTPVERDRIRKDGMLPQILTPEHRIGLTADDEALRRELARELGPELAARCGLSQSLQHAETQIFKFWKSFPERLTLTQQRRRRREEPQSFEELRRAMERSVRHMRAEGAEGLFFRRRFTLADWVGKLGRSELDSVGRGLWFGVSGLEVRNPILPDLLQLLVLARTGASFKGGMSAYRDFLLRFAARLGAQIPQGAECKRIFIESGRFVGVQVASRGSMVGASGGVLGCCLSDTKEYLSVTGKSWVHRLKPAPRPAGWRFTLALTIHAEAIPPGMASRSVWQEQGAPALDLEVADPQDYGVLEPEHRLLFARTLLPFTQESLQVGYQRMIASRILRQLTEIIPFLEFHIVRMYPDFRTDGREVTEAFGFASPELIPENLRGYAGDGLGSRSGVEGLFVASGESFPRLGSFGGTVAALEAVTWLAHRSGLAGPFA